MDAGILARMKKSVSVDAFGTDFVCDLEIFSLLSLLNKWTECFNVSCNFAWWSSISRMIEWMISVLLLFGTE